MYSGAPDYRDDGTVVSHSRVITWERSVSQIMRDDASVISSRTARSVAKAPTEVSRAPSVASKAPSVVSQAPSIARSTSEPAVATQAAPPANSSGDAAKTLVGTLLGAAAGAAVAYAFVRSERDSAKKEADFSVFMDAKNTVKAAVGHLAQASPPPQPPVQDPPPTYEPAPSVARSVHSVHRNDDAATVVSASPSRASQVPSGQGQRQIEAAPASYYAPAPSQVSLSRSQTAEPLQIEYAPARSVAGSDMRSRFSSSRSMTSPEIRTIEAARSVASVSTAKPESRAPSRAQSVAHSTAPSSFISSFVPDNVSRKPEGSVYSHHSSRSKAKSSHTHASEHSSHSKHRSSRSKAEESSPSPPPPASEAPSKKPSKAASVISSILGRDKKSSADSDFIDDLDIEELTEDDYETVVPSDSISQAGSSRRTHRRKHRSRTDELKEEAGTTVSKSSRHSESSKHSNRSHRSHKSRSHRDGDDSDSDHSTESRRRHRSSRDRPSVVSEPSDMSTIKPTKSSSSRHKESRKDSVTEGSKYDDLFDQVQYGKGSVPVRGITPSMINASTNNKNRSVISFALGEKIKAFESRS